ncbi:cupin domain-containing protein [Bradyrhizobium sp. S3.2.6]
MPVAARLPFMPAQLKSFKSGDTFVCEPGLQGTWEVTSPLRKAFVVRGI